MSDMTAPSLFRLRVRYPKQGRLIYLGHLELIHTIERIVRRAGMPYAVTQGFSPHMRVGFTSALPVGTGSTCEWYDLFLTELVPPAEALRRLRDASPADLRPDLAGYVEWRTPALTAQITRQRYRVRLDAAPGAHLAPERVSSALETVRAAGEVAYLRGKKSKRLSIADTLLDVLVDKTPEGVALMLDTHCDNDGSLRPEILIAALDRELTSYAGDEPIQSTGVQEFQSFARYRVTRTWQGVETGDGSLAEPL